MCFVNRISVFYEYSLKITYILFKRFKKCAIQIFENTQSTRTNTQRRFLRHPILMILNKIYYWLRLTPICSLSYFMVYILYEVTELYNEKTKSSITKCFKNIISFFQFFNITSRLQKYDIRRLTKTSHNSDDYRCYYNLSWVELWCIFFSFGILHTRRFIN